MSELKQKLQQLFKEIEPFIFDLDGSKEYFLKKFEEAQEEMERLIEQRNTELKIVDRLLKEEELKQKLDAFHGFLVRVHNQSRDVKVMAFLGGIIKKFEELKEEKEA